MYWAETGEARSRSARARAGGPSAGVFIGAAFFGSGEHVRRGDPTGVPGGALFPFGVYTLPRSKVVTRFMRRGGCPIRRLDPSHASSLRWSRRTRASALGRQNRSRPRRPLASTPFPGGTADACFSLGEIRHIAAKSYAAGERSR